MYVRRKPIGDFSAKSFFQSGSFDQETLIELMLESLLFYFGLFCWSHESPDVKRFGCYIFWFMNIVPNTFCPM